MIVSGHPTMNTTPSSKDRRLVPMTVWLCSDSDPDAEHGATATGTSAGHHRESKAPPTATNRICLRHRQTVGRELARHLIASCTAEEDLVVDAFATGETTVATAADLGRRAVALVPHFPLAQHISAWLRANLDHEQRVNVAMRPCRPDQMARGMADQLARVALVIAAPPPYEVGGRILRQRPTPNCPACQADPWMMEHHQLGSFLAAAWQVLRPSGYLAVITNARRQENGRLIDPAPSIIRQASVLGFRYLQHIIALRVPIEGDTLVVQAHPTDFAELQDIKSGALPPAVAVHADVCLFLKPWGHTSRGGAW